MKNIKSFGEFINEAKKIKMADLHPALQDTYNYLTRINVVGSMYGSNKYDIDALIVKSKRKVVTGYMRSHGDRRADYIEAIVGIDDDMIFVDIEGFEHKFKNAEDAGEHIADYFIEQL